MSVTNIKQEIVDWYNEGLDEDDQITYLGSYSFEEFKDSLATKEYKEKNPAITVPLLESGPAFLVEDVHGEDGDYEARYIIFSVGDQLFQANGYYSSWDGDNWDGASPFEVEAYTETVTRYRSK